MKNDRAYLMLYLLTKILTVTYDLKISQGLIVLGRFFLGFFFQFDQLFSYLLPVQVELLAVVGRSVATPQHKRHDKNLPLSSKGLH